MDERTIIRTITDAGLVAILMLIFLAFAAALGYELVKWIGSFFGGA